MKLGKQNYRLLSSADSIHLISCNQGGENNSPLSLNLPEMLPCAQHSSGLCCRSREGASGSLSPLPCPHGPNLDILIPWLQGEQLLCSSLPPALSFPLSTLIQSICLVLCSICCSNIKCGRRQSPQTTAEMLFRV